MPDAASRGRVVLRASAGRNAHAVRRAREGRATLRVRPGKERRARRRRRASAGGTSCGCLNCEKRAASRHRRPRRLTKAVSTRRRPTFSGAQLLKAERSGVAVREDAHELVVKVVRRLPDVLTDALVVHLAAAVDVFLQPLVEILVLAALIDLRLVVELDLGDEEPCE